MNVHLKDDEMAEWMLGRSGTETAQHLRSCAACRAEAENFQAAISQWRESLQAPAERDPIFWNKQRLAIQDRLARHSFAPLLRWAAAAVMALVLLAAVMLTHSPQRAQRASDDAADDALLLEVDSDIQRDYPVALAPAVLINQERNLALSTSAGPDFSRENKQEQVR